MTYFGRTAGASPFSIVSYAAIFLPLVSVDGADGIDIF